MTGHWIRHVVVSLIAATMLLSGCGATVPSLQPGASIPDLPSRPTEKPTDKPTTKPTDKPTDKPTEKPTDKPTDKPTEKATEKPAEKPTDKATEKPTAEPTAEATPGPDAGSGENAAATSPGLILLVVVLALGLSAALYALYRQRNA